MTPPTAVALGAGSHRARIPPSAWAALVLWVVLALLAPVAVLQGVDQRGTSGALALSAASMILSATGFCVMVARGEPRYMALAASMFVYIWFGLAAIVQLDDGVFERRLQFVGRPFEDATLVYASLLVLVGSCAYAFCYLAGARRGSPQRLKKTATVPLFRLQLLAVFGLLCSLALLNAAGWNPFATRDSIGDLGEGAPTRIARVAGFAGAYLVIYSFRQKLLTWHSTDLKWRVVFILSVVLMVVANNPTVVQRVLAATIFGGLLLAWIPRDRAPMVRAAFISILLSVLIVFPYLNQFRREAPVARVPVAVETGFLSPLRVADGDFGMYSQVANGVEYVAEFGHTDGRHLLATGLVFVPRSIWTSKANDVGDSVHQALGYPDRFNYSSPLWMELFVEGGLPLLVVGFSGLGLLSRKMDDDFVHGDVTRLAVLTPALSCYQFFILRGSLLAATPMLLVMIVLLWFATPERAHPDTGVEAGEGGAALARVRVRL